MPVGDTNSYLGRTQVRKDDEESSERPSPQITARTSAILARSDYGDSAFNEMTFNGQQAIKYSKDKSKKSPIISGLIRLGKPFKYLFGKRVDAKMGND